jgi:glutamyl-tRNA reductase
MLAQVRVLFKDSRAGFTEPLNHLFQTALFVGKQVRENTVCDEPFSCSAAVR